MPSSIKAHLLAIERHDDMVLLPRRCKTIWCRWMNNSTLPELVKWPVRPKVKTPLPNRHIVFTHLRGRIVVPTEIARTTPGHNWHRNCVHTVWRRLRAAGIRSRCPYYEPKFTANHRCFNWAMSHGRWTLRECNNDLWSDVCKYQIDSVIEVCMSTDVRVTFQWCLREADGAVQNISLRRVDLRQKYSVFLNSARGRGCIMAQRYIDQVLRPSLSFSCCSLLDCFSTIQHKQRSARLTQSNTK